MIEHFPRTKTKERILEAAEKLYIEHGIHATSLRQITQEANVNLAAVNYYFGSKDGLTKALFLYRYIPYVRATTQSLGNLPPQHTLTDIINALLLPFEKMSILPNQRGPKIISLLLRIASEFPYLSHQLVRESSEDMAQNLLALLHEVLPHLDRTCLIRRVFILSKAILYSFNGKDLFNLYGDDKNALLEMSHIIAELRIIIAAGLTYPPPENKKYFKINKLNFYL